MQRNRRAWPKSKRRECSIQEAKMATQAREQREPAQSQAGIAATENDWTKPRAMAIPKEGYFKLERGRYGPVYPKSPACYAFTIIWKTNPSAFVKFVREHQCPSFLEYGEYPFVSAGEIKKALKLKAAFSNMLDQMQ